MNDLARLRAYRFDPGATFEGGLVAAFERMQLGKEWEVLDALFVRRDAATDELEAIDLGSGRRDGTFASLLDFRLDAKRRRALTERTLEQHGGGVPREVIEVVAASLETGGAMLAMIHTGPPVAVLDDAVARCGGRPVADEPVDVRTLPELGARLGTIVGSPPPAD
jgi:hypothetical protein